MKKEEKLPYLLLDNRDKVMEMVKKNMGDGYLSDIRYKLLCESLGIF